MSQELKAQRRKASTEFVLLVLVGSRDISILKVAFGGAGGSIGSCDVLCFAATVVAFTTELLWHDFDCGSGGLLFRPWQ